MTCPATQFITDIHEQAKTMTVHKHPDNSQWIHAYGTDGNGDKRYHWTHIVSKQKHETYPCDEYGWVEMQHPPRCQGTLCICVQSMVQFIDEWQQAEEPDETGWLYTYGIESVSHWMPQSQLPERDS